MTSIAGRRIRVTVIDDDEDDYVIICALLRGVGFNQYETDWISNYDDAVESIRGQKSDVYLIDYRMGEKTGLDILSEVRRAELARPMILLTGLADRAVDIISMEKGASDFLEKVHLTSELLERSIRYSIRRSSDLVQIKANASAEVQKDVAEAATVAKSRFLANMSHELRTPLTAVLGFAELAKNPNLPAGERFEFLETILKSGAHLLRIINDILDLSKIEDGHFQIDSTPFFLQETLRGVFEIMKTSALAKGLKFTLMLPIETSPVSGVDECRFKQIMFNTIGNAIKFTQAGSVGIGLEVSVLERTYTVSVTDTGLGMKASEHEQLFKPYSQATTGTSKLYGGTGLGLDLSRMLARALGGELSLVRSEFGSGSMFALRLPISHLQLDIDTVQNSTESAASLLVPFDQMRVLIAEDSRDNQILIQHFLKDMGLLLTFVSNGKVAISESNEKVFDAILMDIQMPEMGGYEATAILRKKGFSKSIIALTAHAFSEERDKAMKSGFTDFVSKPIDRNNLILALKRAEARVKSTVALATTAAI